MAALKNAHLTWTSATDIDIGCRSDTADGVAYWTIDDAYTATHQQSVIHRRPPTPNAVGEQPAAATIADSAAVSASLTQSLGWAQLVGFDAYRLFNPNRTIVTVAPDRCVVERSGAINYTLHPGDYVHGGTRCMYTDDSDQPLPRETTEDLPISCEFGLEITEWTPDNDGLNVLYHQVRAGGNGGPICSVHIDNNNAFITSPDGTVYSSLTTGVNHFRIEMLASREASGWYKFYHNGALVGSYIGANLLDDPAHAYTSRGQYRAAWNNSPPNPSSYMKLKEHYYRESNYEDFSA